LILNSLYAFTVSQPENGGGDVNSVAICVIFMAGFASLKLILHSATLCDSDIVFLYFNCAPVEGYFLQTFIAGGSDRRTASRLCARKKRENGARGLIGTIPLIAMMPR